MTERPSTLRRLLAWGVHFYTALGLVAAGGIALAILDGSRGSFRVAFMLMLIATLIDATDGTLARLVRVKEVLPNFDGRRLDDLIDFHTYASLPLLLILRAHLLPEGQETWLLAPLLASAYGFSQTAVKTGDGYFLGFPSYWNVIAFYLYVLQPPATVAILLLVGFSVLTFVPTRYLYPTQPGRLNRLTLLLGFLWCVPVTWILCRLPTDDSGDQNADGWTRMLALASLFFPVYYLVTSWLVSFRHGAPDNEIHLDASAAKKD